MDIKENGDPVFCLKCNDKISNRKLHVNVWMTDEVEFPSTVLSEDEMKVELISPGRKLEEFLIPMQISPFFYCEDDTKDDYVVNVRINRRFAIDHIQRGPIMKHFATTVILSEVQDKFNGKSGKTQPRQFFGHEMDLDYSRYEEQKVKYVRYTDRLVSNKVTVIQDKPTDSTSCGKEAPSNDQPYELAYRPASNILTCTLSVDRIPKSISFNEDRIIIRGDQSSLMDICLPILIDLEEQVQYKFDDKSCTFRVVFKTMENL